MQKNPFTCDVYSFSFGLNIDLKKHTDSVHKGKKPFKCEFCDYGFALIKACGFSS